MYKGKTIRRWASVISGLFILTATAEKLPPPAEGEYTAREMAGEKVDLAGKIIKVKFNRIYAVRKLTNGLYTGNLRSSEKPREKGDYEWTADTAGAQVYFAQEGLGVFLKSIPEPGGDYVPVLQSPDREEVYVQVGGGTNFSMAVGDEYKKTADEGKYQWSVKTEIPDLAAKQKVSVSDVMLFPDQLTGKIVELEFYDVDKIEQKGAEKYSTFISGGKGHQFVRIQFPAAGLAFFKKIVEQKSDYKGHAVYALIDFNARGVVALAAKGVKVSGEGDNAEYRW